MQNVVQPGTVLGGLLPEVAADCGTKDVPVIAVASHDTASAVAAVPAADHRWAYVSCGTWSLLGIEAAAPIISGKAMAANFTNEGGVGGRIRFLKNIMGLWILQECRRAWGGTMSYDELTAVAEQSPPFRSLIDPDNAAFLRPANMPEAIVAFCRATDQPAPETPAQFARCVLESLALKYRHALDQLQAIFGHPVDVLHIIGGGSRNRVLCQCTAGATGKRVVAGPAEGTAMGNLLVQAMAAGDLPSLDACREVVRRSSSLKEYMPAAESDWQRAFARFAQYLQLNQQPDPTK